jgi:hypothetical protein
MTILSGDGKERSIHDAEKSNRLATCRPSLSIASVADDLRFSLFSSLLFLDDSAGGFGEKAGELASSSSRGSGRGASGFFVFGSLEGCVGYGRAKKYGWWSACDSKGSVVFRTRLVTGQQHGIRWESHCPHLLGTDSSSRLVCEEFR